MDPDRNFMQFAPSGALRSPTATRFVKQTMGPIQKDAYRNFMQFAPSGAPRSPTATRFVKTTMVPTLLDNIGIYRNIGIYPAVFSPENCQFLKHMVRGHYAALQGQFCSPENCPFLKIWCEGTALPCRGSFFTRIASNSAFNSIK